MTWTCGSRDQHTVSQSSWCVCDDSPRLLANQTRHDIWGTWIPTILSTVSCPRVSVGQHLDACYEWHSTASCTNFLPETRTHNIPLVPKLKLNTTQKDKKNTHNPVHGDRWISGMFLHASWLSSHSEWKQRPNSHQNVRRLTLNQIRSVKSENGCATDYTLTNYVMHARTFVWSNWLKIYWVNLNNLNVRAGRRLVPNMSTKSHPSISHRNFSGMEYGAHGFARVLQICISFILWYDEFLFLCGAGAGPKSGRLK